LLIVDVVALLKFDAPLAIEKALRSEQAAAQLLNF
jgi:hypothetical protein